MISYFELELKYRIFFKNQHIKSINSIAKIELKSENEDYFLSLFRKAPILMRRFIVFIVSMILMLSIFYACKKEDINTQEFVKNHLIGRWPLKKHIEITSKNGDTILNDTTYYSKTDTLLLPIDTVIFMADGKYIQKDITYNYTVYANGDSLSITTTPPTKWNIKFLRQQSIILAQERTKKTGSDNFIYYTETQLIK